MIRAGGTVARILPAAPLALFFLFAYVLPVAILTAISFKPDLRASGWTADNYTGFLGDWFNLSILLDTLWLGVQATALTLLIAYPLSLIYMRAGPRLRALLVFLILLPLLTNTVVRTFAWMAILGRNGLIDTVVQTLGFTTEPLRLLYSRTGLIVALAQIYLPMMALPLNNSLARIDPNLLRAAEGLGASRAYIFRTVILPLSLPGAVAGCLLVFAGATTAFITQTLVGGGRQIFMPLFIYQQALGVQRWAFAAAASVAFALTVMLIVYAFNRFARARLRAWMREARNIPFDLAIWATGFVAIVLLVMPTLVVVVMSFTNEYSLRFPPRSWSLRWYVELIENSPQIGAAAIASLQVAVLATAVSTALGTLAAVSLAGRKDRWSLALDALFMSPMVFPAMSLGLALLLILSLSGVRMSLVTLAIGHVVIATPFVIRMVSAAAQQMNPALLDCASSLGASRVYAFVTVTLPLIRPGVISGAIVAFLSSIDHVPVSLMLADPRTETLPIHLWSILEANLDVRVASVSGIIVAATIAVMLVVDRRMFVPGRGTKE